MVEMAGDADTHATLHLNMPQEEVALHCRHAAPSLSGTTLQLEPSE